MKPPARRLRFWVISLSTVLLVAAAAGGLYRRKVQAMTTLPSAPARKGEFRVMVTCRGELKARHTVQITAPLNVPSLRIIWLAPPGGPVKEGDPVARFDPSSAKQQLQENEAVLKQAQATLDQAVAEARITAEQDRRDLASAHYDVERARLEASKAEIVSRLQAEESQIDLKLSQQKLKVQEAAVALHEASDKAKIASLTRLRDKAKDEVELTRHRIEQMELKAPLTGIVVFLSNFSQGWMNAKPFKVGDQAWPGGAIAEIPDLTTLEMEGKVEEIDRARIALGQEVRVRIDSLPELSIPARLSAISPMTEQSFEWPPTRSFRGYAQLANRDARLRPGMNGSMDVVENRIADAISIPAKALFTQQGKPIVYLAGKTGYRPREVQILARNADEVAVSGVPAGAMVTLVEPQSTERKK